MIVDDRGRHILYRKLEDVLGAEGADLLMAHLPPSGWADLATKHDLSTATALLRTELKAEIDGLRTELKAEIDGVRTELKAEIDGVRTELGSLRTELKSAIANLRTDMSALGDQLRAEMHRGFRSQTWALVATMIALVTLLYTATAIG